MAGMDPRQPAAPRSHRGADSWSTMSGETALAREQQPTSESAFGRISQQPWIPVPQLPVPIYGSVLSSEDAFQVGDQTAEADIGEPRVTLGLDYGTTYTGLAFIQQTMERDATFQDLHVFTEWDDGTGAAKIRSAISYSKSPSKCKQWGNDIDKQHSRVLQWTKLELQTRRAVQELATLREALSGLSLLEALRRNEAEGIKTDVPRHIGKSPFNIVQDYLARVARRYYLDMNLNNQFAIGRGNVPVDLAITHPAEWSYDALNKTYRAAMSAFNKDMFPTRRNIYFVPEPEACAVFTVQDMIESGKNAMVPGECFVVCDAGGGTVDLVTYRFKELDPLKLERIGYVSGAPCGATFIDRAFITWIESKITNINIKAQEFGTGGHFVLDPKGNTILGRFEICKRQFTGTETNTITIPSNVEVDPNFAQYANGLLTITAEDMKGFFDFSVSKTLELIEAQVIFAELQGGRIVSHIFMSGGMSQSEYLFGKVTEWAAIHGTEVVVQRPQEGWTAVAQGAVLCAMGIGANNAVLVGECLRHYGISGAEQLSPWKHRDVNIRITADEVHGANMALDQIAWLIRKGDVILPDRPINASCRIACTFKREHVSNGIKMQVIFCATKLENAPRHSLEKDSNEVAVMEIPLNRIPLSARVAKRTPRGEEYLKARMEVKMSVYYDGKVEVKVVCEGNKLASYVTNG